MTYISQLAEGNERNQNINTHMACHIRESTWSYDMINFTSYEVFCDRSFSQLL